MSLPKLNTKALVELGFNSEEIGRVVASLAAANSQLVYREAVNSFTVEELEKMDDELSSKNHLTDEKRVDIVDKWYRQKTGRSLVEAAQEKLQLLVGIFALIVRRTRFKAEQFLKLPEDKQQAIVASMQVEKWEEAVNLWEEAVK